MFKLVKERTAWWPVRWKAASEDGSIIENEIEIKFQVLGRAAYRAMLLEDGADLSPDDIARADMDAARKIVAEDWRGIGDEAGRALPFSWKKFAQLMDEATFPVAMQQAYARMLAATPEIREKNSGGSPVTGRAAARAKGTAKRSRKSSTNSAPRSKK